MRLYPYDLSYAVSKDGNVWSCKSNRFLKKSINSNGYYIVSLCTHGISKREYIHHLVLTTYVSDRPTKMVCRHLDGEKLNNTLSNLKWGSESDNNKDRWKHYDQRGIRLAPCKLTFNDSKSIIALCEIGMTQRQVAKIFKVSQPTISNIIRKISYVHN